MKNTLLFLASAALLLGFAGAKPQAEEPGLKPGDPAPALNVAEWVKGEAIPAMDPGKIYVIEFWATW
ncbi:MAG: hypothetical protein R3F17_02075 [Planctomycetota bacterium]